MSRADVANGKYTPRKQPAPIKEEKRSDDTITLSCCCTGRGCLECSCLCLWISTTLAFLGLFLWAYMRETKDTAMHYCDDLPDTTVTFPALVCILRNSINIRANFVFSDLQERCLLQPYNASNMFYATNLWVTNISQPLIDQWPGQISGSVSEECQNPLVMEKFQINGGNTITCNPGISNSFGLMSAFVPHFTLHEEYPLKCT